MQQAAAIAFKNTVKRQWRSEDGQASVLSDADKEQVKAQVVQLMLATPERVQKQLSEAIAVIAKYDFPDHWQSLMPTLAERLAAADYHAIIGVLRTAQPIFRG